ncbi:YiaA/YiaB family inner membrane protein [Streptomyces sp. TRM 70361]|uniref:YiaA/YiaB family inner membrane protein n=1 Tax=Streptomyces sp. TRM 70361 TaxID=3116553 RepID=UPI002E7B225C|nr:YiaA/YiaB family inner membrane protein [Streptomyces sp. TRM 70361]MEE1939453.1 YiaA/YiaB family inner membrane protein [Streptomyces sp. TRM 70361]
MTAPQVQRPMTAAFFVQSVLSFGLSLLAVGLGVAYLPLGPWERGFLGLGVLFLVSSSFNLAKVVRDRQELQEVTTRVDKARIDKLITEHDPFDPRNV